MHHKCIHFPAEPLMFKGLGDCPRDLKPEILPQWTARVLVLTTKLNCIAEKPAWRAHSSACSARARPTPWPDAVVATMKPALATCAPSPG